MKSRSPFSALAAAVLAILSGVGPASAEDTFSGMARSQRWGRLTPPDVRSPRPDASTPPAGPPVVAGLANLAKYPRYRLIDLGTLGGKESNALDGARGINDRGQAIAVAETDVSDPDCFFGCNVFHAVLRRANGQIVVLPFPEGIDPDHNYSFAGDLTANGLLGGFVTNGKIDPSTDFPQLRPAIWESNGTGVRVLGTFGGGSGVVNMRNRRGDSVGSALNSVAENPDFASFMFGFLPAAKRARAFIWRGHGLEDLGTLGGHDAQAMAINDSGVVFGLSYTDITPNDGTGLPTTHPFLWKNGRMRDLGTLGGSLATPGSFVLGPWGPVLNERGQAVGTSTLAGDEYWHAFLWDSGTMIDLGTLGGNVSEALAINENGWIVGVSDLASDSPFHHAVLWRNGDIRDLGAPAPCRNTTAVSVNARGDVVGDSGLCADNPDDPAYHSAFMWRPGSKIVRLDALVVPPSRLHVESASSINDRGEIVGNALLPSGEKHAVVLKPLDYESASQ